MHFCPQWKSQLRASNAHVQSKQDQNTSDTKSKWLAATFTQFLQPLLGWYMSATSVYAQDVHAMECMRETERESQVLPKRPDREETMPTYAFCVLQTFHRLCKTSESVRPLELREEGRGGGDRWADRSVFKVTAVYLPSHCRVLSISMCVLIWSPSRRFRFPSYELVYACFWVYGKFTWCPPALGLDAFKFWTGSNSGSESRSQ